MKSEGGEKEKKRGDEVYRRPMEAFGTSAY